MRVAVPYVSESIRRPSPVIFKVVGPFHNTL